MKSSLGRALMSAHWTVNPQAGRPEVSFFFFLEDGKPASIPKYIISRFLAGST